MDTQRKIGERDLDLGQQYDPHPMSVCADQRCLSLRKGIVAEIWIGMQNKVIEKTHACSCVIRV